MPNHVHGIIMIVGAGSRRPGNLSNYEGGKENRGTPEGGGTPPLQKQPPLSQIIGYFKYESTKDINILRKTPGVKLWQRGFYEHVIRDDESLNRIREYIESNPLRWDLDKENPKAVGKDDFDLLAEHLQDFASKKNLRADLRVRRI
jgi:hypothetical protein